MIVETKSAPMFTIYESMFNKLKNSSKETLEDYVEQILIKNWYGYVSQADEMSQNNSYRIFEYEKDDYDYAGISFPWAREKPNIQILTQDIFDILEIKTNKKIDPYDMIESYKKNTQ